jgi:cytochrome b561
MAARAECPPHSLPNSYPQERRRLAVFACAAIMVVAVGVLGLEGVSWLRQLVESWINIHLLFGLLLCALVLVRYHWIIRYAPHLHEDIRELSRHLSRIVYLMLYAVIGGRLGIGLVNWIWHGGSLDLTLLDEGLRNDDDGRVFNPHHDYHMILLSGGITLGMVRVFLTGCLVHRSRRE